VGDCTDDELQLYKTDRDEEVEMEEFKLDFISGAFI
jgi:hypothetical protein